MPTPRRKPAHIDFRALRAAVSIVQVLERYELLAGLQEKRDGYRGSCPLCESGGRPFHVSISKNAWFCFSCDEGGNVLDLVAAMEGVAVREAAALIAEWFDVEFRKAGGRSRKARRQPAGEVSEPPDGAEGTPPPETDRVGGPRIDDLPQGQTGGIPQTGIAATETPVAAEAPTETGRVAVNRPLSFPGLKNLDPGHSLLKPLGFARATLERFEAGFCSRGMMAGRLAIPIHNADGQLVAYIGRDPTGKEPDLYPPNFRRELELYNYSRIRWRIEDRSDGLIVMPDVFDVWRLYEAGMEPVVALLTPMVSAEQAALLISAGGAAGKLILALPPGPDRDAAVLALATDLYVSTAWGRRMVLPG